MADTEKTQQDQQVADTEPQVDEPTRLKAELAAERKRAREIEKQLKENAEKLNKISEMEASLTARDAVLREYLRARYDAAPEVLREELPWEALEKKDPLAALTELSQVVDFFAKIEARYAEKNKQQAGTVPPPPPQAGAQQPGFTSHIDFVKYLAAMRGQKQ